MKHKLWRGLLVVLACFAVISAVAACGGRSRDPVVHISSIDVLKFDQNSNAAFLWLKGFVKNIPEGYSVVIVHKPSTGDGDMVYLSLPAFPIEHTRTGLLEWDTWINITVTPEMTKLGETYIGYALLETDASYILAQAIRAVLRSEGMDNPSSISLPIERYAIEQITLSSNFHLDKVTLRTEHLSQVGNLSYWDWSYKE